MCSTAWGACKVSLMCTSCKKALAQTWVFALIFPSYRLVFLCPRCHKWIIFPAAKLNRRVLREITSCIRGHYQPMKCLLSFNFGCVTFRESRNFQIPSQRTHKYGSLRVCVWYNFRTEVYLGATQTQSACKINILFVFVSNKARGSGRLKRVSLLISHWYLWYEWTSDSLSCVLNVQCVCYERVFM